MKPEEKTFQQKPPSIFGILKNYRGFLAALVFCQIIVNGGNLFLPKIIAQAVDRFTHGNYMIKQLVITFALVSLGVGIFYVIQTLFQAIVAERVARDMRSQLIDKISRQNYAYVQTVGSEKLLTNLTSDIDGVKTFVSQAIVMVVFSLMMIIGASISLFVIDWRLALAVLAVLPIIGIAFGVIFGKAGPLFKQSREVIDRLNRVINENILGAVLIRVIDAHKAEELKFTDANAQAQANGFKVLRVFALIIPIITFVANVALAIILALGGHFVIGGSMSLGDFTAFTSYVGLLIFPIIMLGFISTMIAQAQASYNRIAAILSADDSVQKGTVTTPITGNIEINNLSLEQGEKIILKDVNLLIKPGTRTAIFGPTAAGKTQLLYLLIGLINPTSGTISYNNISVADYDPAVLHKNVGFVFQDSVIFNTSVRENIAFAEHVSDESMKKAIETAELSDFIAGLPQGIDTIVSERGTSLSGGQKQRVMLARALALDPTVLFLDDFTARVDVATESRILGNIAKNYPKLTLISVTQKVASAEQYDSIVVLMEGELIAQGTHEELLESSPEYVQIVESQKSTETL